MNENGPRMREMSVADKKLLMVDFSHASRAEGKALFEALQARLQVSEKASVRLLIDLSGASIDPEHVSEWKKHLPLFNERLSAAAVVGMAPLLRLVVAGVRMYAKLMGENGPALNFKVFDRQNEAIEHLTSN